MQRWQYHTTTEPTALSALGAEGWELIAVQDATWVFKRPEPDPITLFTEEQRAAALGDVVAHRAHTRSLLNPEVAALIRRVNHTQLLLVADRGFPVPWQLPGVDLSVTADLPTIPQVLLAILPELPADRLIVAEEQQEAAPERWAYHAAGPPPLRAVPHTRFKELAERAVGWIRTGDSAPYGNVLIVGG